MGNGVDLRMLANNGGSVVISDYGAHLFALGPGRAGGCGVDAEYVAYRGR